MITMILWLVFVMLPGMDHPQGAVTPTRERCEEVRQEMIQYAAEEKLPILSLSDCTPVHMKSAE